MSHSLSIQNISQLLSAPHAITGDDLAKIGELKKKYPYFLPAHYMLAATQNRQQAFSPAMLANMQLYMGNWLLFCQYLEQSRLNVQHDYIPVVEVVAAAEIEEVQLQENPLAAQPEQPFYSENNIYTDTTTNDEDTEDEVEEDVLGTKNYTVEQVNFDQDNITTDTGDRLILPVYTEDYFRHQGIQVSNDLPADIIEEINPPASTATEEEDKSLMVMMSFSEWLLHFKTRTQKEKEERDDQKALKTMWQKEKLAAALEEENEEIPENVFEMAVNSITKEEGLVSEALADVYEKQGKHEKAIDMYRKLSLRNPQKNAYFARKIENILKEKDS